MLSANQVNSFAGTWGKERKVKLVPPGKLTGTDYSTTFSSSFDADKFSSLRRENDNKFAKFVSFIAVYFLCLRPQL